jgi:hypothetical protein
LRAAEAPLTDALVSQADWPGAKAQALLPCASTKIRVVEVKVELRIELNLGCLQFQFPGRKKYAIQQFAFGGNLSPASYYTERANPIRDAAAQIFRIVQNKGIVDKAPIVLVRHTAAIAGNANDIECVKPFNDALREEIVVYPDIVMNKNKYCIGTIGLNSRIVDIEKAGVIFECYVRNMRHLLFQPSQREA